ncbi:MAG: FadR/GntR family transcriptional regulator [Polaromonas sp.]|nr:FadR/GntR family transcriptional regulator [Polaromonas sp.]
MSQLLLPSDPTHIPRQALLDGLRSGRWIAGDRLPAERQLCEQFGIGRTALRRVLRELRESGLIEQVVGSGTYVAADLDQKLPVPTPSATAVSPAELMEARLLLEPLMVDLVVGRATAADFDGLEECCRNAEAAGTLEEFEHWDGMLHERIAQATHNGFFITVFRQVSEVRRHGEWGMLKKKSVTPERRAQYQQEHRALVAALRNRDADQARRLMLLHLQVVQANLLGRPAVS